MFPFASGLMLRPYSPLSVSASPTSVSGSGSSAGAVTINSTSTTVTVSGGLPPYSYAWSILSGSFTAASPTSATTSFSESLAPGSDSGTARCTVSSSDGQVKTADVAVSLSNTYVAPQPPVWNVANNTNMMSVVHGDPSPSVAEFFATSPDGANISYNILGDFGYAGGTGPEPTFPTGTPVASGFHYHLFGSASAGVTPGTYSLTATATNLGSAGGQSSITILVTVT